MANIKITELNSLSEKQDTDVLPIVDISENETKKIKIEDLLERDVSLLAVSETAPAQCLVGDKYFNITTNKIYTATGTNTWGSTGENAVAGIMYIVFDKQRVYAYNGTTLVSVGGGSGGESLPIGTIIPFTSNTIPEEYKLCDGSAISRTTYSDLFEIIGTTYGAGDGSTTFNLPDLRGRVGVGKDSDDTDFDTLGETGGSKELQQHRHQSVYGSSFVSGDLDEHTYENVGFVANGTPIAGAAYYNTRYEGTGNSGNVQPYQVVNYIIKVIQATPTTAEIVDGYGTSTDKGYSQKYLNDKIDGYVLYENSSGTTSDILIQNHQFSEFKYIDIYNQLGVLRVFKTGYNTNSGIVYSDTLYLSYFEYNIISNSNSISINVSRSGTYFMNDNHPESFKTYQVIGYK